MVTLLTIGFALNLLDRQIVNILGELIKRDLGLADWQLGALSGLSFALLYSTAAIPIARLADRSNRVTIIGVAIITWSAFTAACGAASNFIQLLLCRVGVGVGEAGGAPPSQSLIADSVSPDRRSGALAVFALGAPIGASIGLIGGGLLAGLIGWRWTMVAAGAPGILIGALVLLTLRDPRDGRQGGPRAAEPSLRAALGQLLAQRAFVLMALGGALLSFVNYGAMAFAGSFYLRNHLSELTELGARVGLPPLGVIGIGLGLLGASGGALGALVGGKLGDRFGTRDVRALTIIPAVGSVFCAAGYLIMFTLPGALWSLATFALASFFSNLWYGPGTLGLQRLAGPKAKATALAVALFVNSAIGLSLGPLLIGIMSDAFTPALGEGEALRAGILIGLSAGLLSGLLYWFAARSIDPEIRRAEAAVG
jgi:MFS family permease